MKISLLQTTLLGMALCFSAHAQVILSGSSPLGKILEPKKAAIEAAAKTEIKLVLKNTGAGVRDVSETSANIGMVAGPADQAIKNAGIAPASAAKLQSFEVGKSKIAFVVNSANPVAALTAEQIKDIFAGKVTNWKDVGGADMPIQVHILSAANNGARIAADAQLLGAAPLVAGAIEHVKPPEISTTLAQTPGGISFIGISDVGTGVKIVNDSAATLPLYLLTFGEPEEEEKAVIEAVKAELAK